ncbi:hypothetical protein EC604_01560 [Paenibacillus amylolyticus]|uniref:Uncharacterized protein n=1 Tax=Paenibacillus amylolyticus TaxID=1451 RepID=A0A5M9WLV1_PAEAM|nr:hypothetical protein [Paenibacillus amylolyticus]KAA8782535.1 hypothetical protein EC604_01560 [Paenibacillus amylolyticus]
MYADFVWQCPSCKKNNHERYADEHRFYKCEGCGKQSTISFSIEVDDVELYEEQKQVENLLNLKISKDQGNTWDEIRINPRDTNPETSPLKPDDLLMTQNGNVFKVILDSRSRISTTKVS